MKKYLNINESFIVKIWIGGNLYYSNLKTTEGLEVSVLDYGKQNNDGGPDFNYAKVKIADRIFTGDIEIHKDFNSWYQHGHKNDRKYNSVILQVLLWDYGKKNLPVVKGKRQIPTVILSKFLNQSIHEIWQKIIQNPSGKFKLPCYSLNNSILPITFKKLLGSLAFERLNIKSQRMEQRLTELELVYSKNIRNSMIWNKLLMEFIFEALGYSKNKEPFLKLGKIVDLIFINKYLMKCSDRDLKIYIQAVLFGLSGLMFDIRASDKYIIQVKKIFNEIKSNLKSEIMLKTEWQFFKLRPQNFPTVRIAYASQLIIKMLYEDLLKNIINIFKNEFDNCENYLRQLLILMKPMSDNYWNSHYNFGKQTKINLKLLGKQREFEIISNVIIPFVYFYSVVFQDTLIKKNILKFYSELKISPKNSIIKLMNEQIIKTKNINIDNPAVEQGIMQLYHSYCLQEKYHKCEIGKLVFSDSGYDYKLIFY